MSAYWTGFFSCIGLEIIGAAIFVIWMIATIKEINKDNDYEGI